MEAVQSDGLVRLPEMEQRFGRVSLTAPVGSGFIHLAVELDRARHGWFARARTRALVNAWKSFCERLRCDPGVNDARVFRRLLSPPGRSKGLPVFGGAQRLRYDVVILIETDSVDDAQRLVQSARFHELEASVRASAMRSDRTIARNVKRIGPVDHTRQGVFLFNYFFAEDTAQNLAVWEYTAGWFERETELHNSTVLLPLAGSEAPYTLVNHCRWDRLTQILPALLFKRSFRTFVLRAFRANRTTPTPILFRLA